MLSFEEIAKKFKRLGEVEISEIILKFKIGDTNSIFLGMEERLSMVQKMEKLRNRVMRDMFEHE